MADLEKQVAAHNILHKEVESYSSQLSVSSAGSKVNPSACMKTPSPRILSLRPSTAADLNLLFAFITRPGDRFAAASNACSSCCISGELFGPEETVQQYTGELICSHVNSMFLNSYFSVSWWNVLENTFIPFVRQKIFEEFLVPLFFTVINRIIIYADSVLQLTWFI